MIKNLIVKNIKFIIKLIDETTLMNEKITF